MSTGYFLFLYILFLKSCIPGYFRPGVTAGKTAEMEVVAVPSLPKQLHLYTAADEVINSLLDLRLEKWGLPPFEDWVEGTLPLDPWYIVGPVVKGFGRDSKVLGIPIANLSTKGYSDLLSEHPAGVYFGWAGLSARGVFKMVMSIGWNPYFNNKEKTIEPWLLHDFNEDFYGEELRLVIVGYIRPELLVQENPGVNCSSISSSEVVPVAETMGEEEVLESESNVTNGNVQIQLLLLSSLRPGTGSDAPVAAYFINK
ncbi:Bifunctional riboflavin kinase/FMN phosphatase [Glycine soja]